ncbi:MAG: methionine adenosyltransferase [Micrococcales bacterium]|nr:methionine adenosyltransferase [Microbacteriaceae bacterium]NBR22623.1 methionine adenosyltransferase [Micrococcales bacterium]NBX94154.1 methionine adenosyltransferase [Actinomycetota bacterium]NBR77392.1 methionine adenosyltransferase [Microbacteriaceae bacterium]NBS60511.1 methionine adenosyltransferase [Microbacteriaceae bacterium]
MNDFRYFTSESVTEGHPDKICDQISDAILDDLLSQDKHSRVAVETLVTTGLVHVAGEITTEGYAEIPDIVRSKLLEIGYNSSDIGFDGNSCGVSVSIGKQSPDIAMGVDKSLEARTEATGISHDEQGAGDQGLMFGFACNETPELMPLPIKLSHALAERLAQVRHQGVINFLRPDGKTQATIGYENGVAKNVKTIVVSTQHNPGISHSDIKQAVTEFVIEPVLQSYGFGLGDTEILVNPTSLFVIGGPQGDAGLTGRKIIVDTYGGYSRHGGGAFSGKDPSKVDRSAAYATRWVAKNVVAAGLADKAEIQVSYAIGRARPLAVYVETFGTEKVDPKLIEKAISEVFDLRPSAIIEALDLLRPIYGKTASYGHFGRELPDFTWERTDRVEDLRSAVGL